MRVSENGGSIRVAEMKLSGVPTACDLGVPATASATAAAEIEKASKMLAGTGFSDHLKLSPSVRDALGTSMASLRDQLGPSVGAASTIKGIAEAIRQATGDMDASVKRAVGRPLAENSLRDALKGLDATSGLKGTGLSSVERAIAELDGSNDKLKAALGGTGLADWRREITSVPEPLRFPELPPNPIHETNDHLESLAAEIGQLREITAATAEMQQRQVELVAAILAKVVEEAASSAKDTRRNHVLSLIGIVIAVIGTLLTLL